MKPDAARPRVPGRIYGPDQEVLPEPAADGFRQQPEVRDLARAVVVARELEVARRRALGVEHVHRDAGLREVDADLVVRPGRPVGPAPRPADLGVQITIEGRR